MKPGIISFLIITAVFVQFLSPVEAQGLTLSEAVRIAIERNLDVLSARDELDKAEGLVKVAKGSFYPSLSTGGDFTTRKENLSGSDTEIWKADLTLNQTVYQGGKLRAYRSQADYNLASARRNLSFVEEETALQVYSGFYSILLNKENVITAKDALAYAGDYAQELRKRREVGLATDLEVTRAEQLLATSRKDLVSAQNQLESARINLARLLKIAVEEIVNIDRELDYDPVEADGDSSFSYAIENNPQLEVLRQQVRIQEENITIARSGLRPKVNMSASWEYDDSSSGAGGGPRDDDTWSVRIRADFPIFDSGITKGKVEQEKATLRQSSKAVEKQEDVLKANIETIILELDTAEKNVIESIKNMELATESLRLAEVGVREGVGIQLDILESRRSLTQARLSWAAAVTEYEIKLAELKKAEGRLVNWVLESKDSRED